MQELIVVKLMGFFLDNWLFALATMVGWMGCWWSGKQLVLCPGARGEGERGVDEGALSSPSKAWEQGYYAAHCLQCIATLLRVTCFSFILA